MKLYSKGGILNTKGGRKNTIGWNPGLWGTEKKLNRSWPKEKKRTLFGW